MDIKLFGNPKTRMHKDDYKCHEPIFISLDRLNLKGSHTIEVHWFRPDGKREEITVANYKEVENATKTIEFKLVISPKQFSILNPMDFWIPFIGRWEARVFLDREMVGKKVFNVVC